MACGATLKRTMDFDPLMNTSSPKRRRCAPVSPSATSSPQKYLRMEPSPFGEVSSRLTTEQILENIKQEYRRMQKRRHLESGFHHDGTCSSSEPHSHHDGTCSSSESHSHHGGTCSSSESHRSTLSVSTLPGTSLGATLTRKEQPLLTLRQVGLICERLLSERQDKVRQEYEEILTTKLAEQYDAFVKFTHDQLMRRFGEQPSSYVS